MPKRCDFPVCLNQAEYRGVIDPDVSSKFVSARKMTVRAGMFSRHVQVCGGHEWMLLVAYSILPEGDLHRRSRCPICGEYFHSLGISRHVRACMKKRGVVR